MDDELIKSMVIAEVFKSDPICRANSMDYFANGESLVTAFDDGTVLLYDAIEAKVKTKIYCRKYGMGNVKFTHHPSAIIGSSTRCNFDFSIRYLSLHDYTYIREFRGHNDSVVSIAVSPSDDTFVSGAMDSSVRFWDLKSSTCIAVLKKQGHHVVAYDPTGVAFCCASPNNLIKLFDLRGLSKGPFSTFKLANDPVDFLDIQFSDDGKWLLITTNSNICFLLDAYGGQLHIAEIHGITGAETHH